MNFARFERRAREMFDEIPRELRHGVEFVAVHPEALPHPTMPDIYTLGECATGEYDLPGPDQPEAVRSGVHLYHGSFRELAKLDPEFDWEEELWETLTHEIRHHRESAAGEDALEELDWAEDENFKRRDGKEFEPFFYRAGIPVAPGAWEVDGDLFVERPVTADEIDDEEVTVTIDGSEVVVPIPAPLGDVHFVYLEDGWDGDFDVAVVLIRKRGAWEQLRGLLSGSRPKVRESTLGLDDPDDERERGPD
jgi:predicted Zn-dependent protease with MMP-like domain